ncbi:CIC11C00000003135 [Sungouiella intermedia]|uniref:CIC11C00000003135 n=1 Tax=Sungouiella intermedia TaxID=45354 RepID=A0A1L0G4X6_9ASCO|nr:CIC11C00000003135 [[Candida] intermedia]
MTNGSNSHTHNLYPNIIKDSSTGSAGIVAGELVAEDEGLISIKTLGAHSYGAMESSSSKTSVNVTEESIGEAASMSEETQFALPRAQLTMVISSLYMASFLAALDTTVVTTLLTVIASELDAVENIGWIATAYLLSCSAFQPLFGKLSDIFGRKVLLLVCCFFFAVGCCICVTDSLLWLVVGRFVTGIGGSGLTTLGTITMSDLIPLRERGLYQGLANIFFGLGAASGGIIGGLVSDALGWRYVFIIQVPLAVIVGSALWMFLNLPEGSPGLGAEGSEFKDKLKRVDFLGAFFLVSSLMIILTAATLGGQQFAYSSMTFITLVVVSLMLLGSFVLTELFISKEPIIPMNLMVERTVLASSLANWFYTMGTFVNLFYVPLFFQIVIGMSATDSGLRLVTNFFAVSLGSVGAGLYMRQTGRYYNYAVIVGILALLGMANIINLNANSAIFTQFTVMLLPGFAYASILTITLLSLIAAVPVKFQACTTSIQYTFRATGSTLGVSIASAIFQAATRSSLSEKLHQIISDEDLANQILKRAMENTNYAKEAPEAIKKAIRSSYGLGCRGAFIFSAICIFLGYTSSLLMKEHVLHTSMNRD